MLRHTDSSKKYVNLPPNFHPLTGFAPLLQYSLLETDLHPYFGLESWQL